MELGFPGRSRREWIGRYVLLLRHGKNHVDIIGQEVQFKHHGSGTTGGMERPLIVLSPVPFDAKGRIEAPVLRLCISLFPAVAVQSEAG
jgi:hypothetical protein